MFPPRNKIKKSHRTKYPVKTRNQTYSTLKLFKKKNNVNFLLENFPSQNIVLNITPYMLLCYLARFDKFYGKCGIVESK